MKKILLGVLCAFGLLSSVVVSAQSFTTTSDPGDTVYATVNGGANVPSTGNFITNISAHGGLVLKWRVISTDFPSDWLTNAAFGICDNNICYNNGGDTAIWNNSTMVGSTHITNTVQPYVYDTAGDFHLALNLTGATSSGSHYVNVYIWDPSTTPSYSKTITFIINRSPTGVPSINNAETNVTLYPNPAHNELNIVYDASADVKNIALYNIIGKVMAIYKVTDNTSANLNMENVPSGLYFVRLVNSHGDVVVTRKFTKQ